MQERTVLLLERKWEVFSAPKNAYTGARRVVGLCHAQGDGLGWKVLDPGPAISGQRGGHLGAKLRPTVPEEHSVIQRPGGYYSWQEKKGSWGTWEMSWQRWLRKWDRFGFKTQCWLELTLSDGLLVSPSLSRLGNGTRGVVSGSVRTKGEGIIKMLGHRVSA